MDVNHTALSMATVTQVVDFKIVATQPVSAMIPSMAKPMFEVAGPEAAMESCTLGIGPKTIPLPETLSAVIVTTGSISSSRSTIPKSPTLSSSVPQHPATEECRKLPIPHARALDPKSSILLSSQRTMHYSSPILQV